LSRLTKQAIAFFDASAHNDEVNITQGQEGIKMMKLFQVYYKDGRKVVFTAFSLQVGCDWAFAQGEVASWDAVVYAGLTVFPTWSVA